MQVVAVSSILISLKSCMLRADMSIPFLRALCSLSLGAAHGPGAPSLHPRRGPLPPETEGSLRRGAALACPRAWRHALPLSLSV